MSSLIPQIPYTSENLETVNRHLATLEKKISSTFWESRRNEQRTVPNLNFGLLEIEGLYQSSSIKPPLLRFRRSSRVPVWIHLEPRHRLHRTYKKRYSNRIPKLLKDFFSEYDLAKAWYVLDIIERFKMNPTDMLEIGGGVGLAGIAVRSKYSQTSYVDIDLNEMLPSATILALAMEPSQNLGLLENGFKVGKSSFVSNVELPDTGFDLGINMTSFQEMDDEQIREYMSYLSSAIKPGGFFISINRDRKVHDDLKLSFLHAQVKWPSSFIEIHSEESLFSKYSGKKITISTKVFKIS